MSVEFFVPFIKSPLSFILGAIIGVALVLLYYYLRHRKAQRFLTMVLADRYTEFVVSPHQVLYLLRQGKWQSTATSDPPPAQILTFQDLFLSVDVRFCISVTGKRRLLWQAFFEQGNLKELVFHLLTASRKYRPEEIPPRDREALQNIYVLLSNTASS